MRSPVARRMPVPAPALIVATIGGIAAVFREAPWEDEIFSLRVFEDFHGYRLIPASFAWILAGGALSRDFHFLRFWCFLPWLGGLVLARRLLLRFGATPGDAARAMLCLAANPYLINECKSIRYYGWLFLAAMAAMLAAVHLVRDRPRGWRRIGAFGLILLPQLVVYSGAGLIAILLGWWCWSTRPWRGARRELVLPVAAGITVALLVAWPLRWHLRTLWHAGVTGIAHELPLVLGFAKAPPGADAVIHQYSQLLGLSPLAWWIPSVVVEGAAGVMAAVALGHLLRRGPQGTRGLAASVALIPLVVVAFAPIANLICVRYYLYASVPLAWAAVFALRRAGESLRGTGYRLAPAVVLGTVLAASFLAGTLLRTDPPLDRLAATARRLGITQLAVDPPGSTAFLGCWFRLRGVEGIQVREAVAGETSAEWIFRKDPRWTWPNPHKAPPLPPPDPAAYDVVETFESLKRFYFHDDRVVDRLYRRRDRTAGRPPAAGAK